MTENLFWSKSARRAKGEDPGCVCELGHALRHFSFPFSLSCGHREPVPLQRWTWDSRVPTQPDLFTKTALIQGRVTGGQGLVPDLRI